MDLIRRYEVNGPRYTSYPTANLFRDDFDPSIYEAALAERAHASLSIYVHVPFCATVCYYCACNRIITNNRRHAVGYLQRLKREIALVRERLSDSHRVEQLHFGGGTPTYLDDAQLGDLFAVLRDHFRFGDEADSDISIEIDPRTVDAARIEHLARLGINRMSLGVQDFDPHVQAAVNRRQSAEDTRAVMEAARGSGVRSLSVDLIYGLPLQTRERFAVTLDTVIALNPDRISLYSYAHLPGRFKTQRQIQLMDLPNAETKLLLLQMAVERFSAAGYVYIGMDHFARPDDSLARAQAAHRLHRNFQGYTTHGHCDLIGLGVSAISQVGTVYAQNCKALDAYTERLDRGQLAVERGLIMTADDQIRRDLILELMCHFRVDTVDFSRRHGIDFAGYFAAALARLKVMAEDDLVELKADTIIVTRRGRFLIRNVCMAFDAHLAPGTQGFSKAI
ncbi:MAG: oxygen-independent coproporphyrinogen III oxidase [Pseudomonadales bacterium]